ncbi:hypothetical protein PanWU01x14_345940 [Parasponia andersonii]|uniref:DUF1677 family protein n=1 Tax=Parasponia andersonii TaxID=3476 RepID=A0A2P5ACJ3_PARAD|nr:hypothetical protein PanWU01x14_345940 [Parasponia andersonii]
MSATIVSDPMVISASESQAAGATKLVAQIEIEFAKCDCCGLTEECTPAYIERIRERFQGHWICGLCAEAIKDEIVRSKRLISTEEAMAKHINFFKKFKATGSGPPPDPTVHLISAMRQILRRSLDSPRAMRSTPSSPVSKIDTEICGSGLARSESCFPTLSGFDGEVHRVVGE